MEHSYDDDDELKAAELEGKSKRKEFDCPSCNANNPVDEPFGEGDELLCNYCGSEYVVKVSQEGRIKLKEL